MPFLNITSNFRNLKFNSGRRYIPSTTPSFTTVLDLQSAFTTLQFGNDRPGYGSSGLPYIQTQIPGEPGSPGLYKPIFRPGSTGNLDYPIRGGDTKFQIGQDSYTLSSQIDSVRIKKFFQDAPRGIAFINKQVGLQLTNPKIETGNVLFGTGQGLPVPGILENTRVYNQGRNTLAQIRVSGTGGHALRHGLVPFAAFQKHYYLMVNEQNVTDDKNKNRLVNLNALKMTSAVSPFVNPENVLDINLVNTLGISLNRNLLFQYLGGPGSAYGIGSTTIKRAVDTTQLGTKIKPAAGRNAMTYDLLKSQKANNGGITVSNALTELNGTLLDKTRYKTKDFRDQLDGVDGTYVRWNNPKTGEDNRVETRFFAVSPGKYQDKMNMLKPFLFNNDAAPWEYNKKETDDMIKFVFEAISNDDPNYSTAIFFRAFLTAGIVDNNSAVLNPFRYIGRGENFYTYQGFERSIAFSFRIAAGSKDELFPLYNKLNNLISQVYPDYSDKTKIMRAPIVRVTIGDYLYRMPGFLESVNVTVDNGYPWEVNLDGDSAQLPQVLDVSVSFKPILAELPRRASIKRESSVNESDLQTTYTTTIDTDNPQLIANNDQVIQPSNISIIQNSIFKQPTLIQSNLSPLDKPSFNAAAAGRARAAAAEQLDDFFSTGGFKNN